MKAICIKITLIAHACLVKRAFDEQTKFVQFIKQTNVCSSKARLTRQAWAIKVIFIQIAFIQVHS